MKVTLPLFFLILFQQCLADEGMWMPNQLKKREAAMVAAGLKIPVTEIYSEERPSLKDAVVQFGGGCTGELISGHGLVLTNHHCGYSQIQSLSSIEHNYVENGFWALDKSQEIRCPGLTVTLVCRIENVTDSIFAPLKSDMNAQDREEAIAKTIERLEKNASKEKWQTAKIKSYYHGNEYYLTVMETFRDIRFVGAPPSSIGRFGGDTDNWMWPRHTGDFSLFRIYADSSNRPAAYSDNNIPYTPKKFFTLSAKGVKEGDFTMVFGFPGRTSEYIPSFSVDLIQNVNDPAKVAIRDRRLAIWRERMHGNDTVNLKYASKYGSIANYWKKWIGEMQGLRRSNVIAEKQEAEKKFIEWVAADNRRREEYAGLLHEMELHCESVKPATKLNDYYNEAILGVEVISYIGSYINALYELSKIDTVSDALLSAHAERLKKGIAGYFRNYDTYTDQLVMASMLQLFHDSIATKMHPELYRFIQSKYKGDYRRYAAAVFRKSVFANESKLSNWLDHASKRSLRKVTKDPAFLIYQAFTQVWKANAAEAMTSYNQRMSSLQSRYMKAQLEMNDRDSMYPDANLTMRVSYGQVRGYHPRDAVTYDYQTSLSGLIEKYIPGDPDFDLPSKLLELWNSSDYGPYEKNGDVPVGFIATNHTTGGNSGSPVINASGELIGTNFDRVWEGTLSDIQFDISLCRNIALDIRFTLFVIEKLGSAKNILDELVISK